MIFVKVFTLLLLSFNTLALDKEWWKHTTLYEVFIRSFKDSNGDGIGDLRGLISKLDYFDEIGVETIYLTPFYPSPMDDTGYDITDFTGVDPTYGTMEDFDELIREVKKRGYNLVIDLVINHSSDEHEWFQKSIDRVEPYTNYYIWVDPKGHDYNGNPIPPNNWVSIFDFSTPGSSWTWNEKRKQYYFHQFGKKQPDFNLRNELVKNEIKAILKFWLDKGITAFRVDAVSFFMEDPSLRDEQYGNEFVGLVAGSEERTSRRLHHPDTFTYLNELYLWIRQYDRKNKKQKESAILAEIYAHIDILKNYYGTSERRVTHCPFNSQLSILNKYLDAEQMKNHVNIVIEKIPEWATPLWALGNHDQGRIFQKFNSQYNSILLPIVHMLPGSNIIYYGEEFSQEEFEMTPEHIRNPWFERDLHRQPMQWDDTPNAGFTSGEKPWLPVHPGYWRLNAEAQKAQKNSTLHFFKDLMTIRKTDVLKYGDLKYYTISKWVLAIARTYKDSKYIAVLNLGTESSLVNLRSSIVGLPDTLKVVVASPNSGYVPGEQFSTISHRRNLSMLRPHSSIVLTVD